MHSVAFALLLTGRFVSNGGVAQADVPASTALCYPAVVRSGPARDELLSDIALNLFKSGTYRAAARAYYQLFRCGEGGTPISPVVSDDHQLAPFDAALREATEGRFVTAVASLKRVLKSLPEFGEARLLLGVFQWSAGMRAEAKATWWSTITAPYFTQPPDFDAAPWDVTEAAKLLWWASQRTR
ncbi:MAG: tetratricopeptide repeat protein [Candidatus Baltobacteraceae bacterium]